MRSTRSTARPTLVATLLPFLMGAGPHRPEVPDLIIEEFDLEEQQAVAESVRYRDEVVTTATRRAQRLADAPAIMAVITAEEIRDRGYRSVGEALRSVPGLYVYDDFFTLSAGVRGVHGGLRARSRTVKVLLDGHPVSFRPSNTNFLGPELVPIGAVHRIEVVRGPASALYGANAFLGVINVVTVDPAEASGARAVLRGITDQGNAGGGAELRIAQASGGVDFLLAGAFTQEDRSGLMMPGSSPLRSSFGGDLVSRDDLAKRSSFLGRLAVGDDWTGRFRLLTSYRQIEASGEWHDFQPLTHETTLSVATWSAFLSWDRALGDKLDLFAALGASGAGPTSRDRISPGTKEFTIRREFGSRAMEGLVEVRVTPLPRQLVTLGVDLSNDVEQPLTRVHVSAVDGVETLPAGERNPERTLRNTGIYAQAMLDPRVWGTNLIFGYRLDTHNVYGTAHSWRGGLVAPLPRDVYLKVLVGRAFQAPSAELLYAQQLGDRDVVGNPDLIPETIDTVEALVSWAPWPGLELSLDAYFNQIRNKVELVLEANRSQARNLAEIRTLGYEGEVRWSSGKTSAFANAAFQTTVRQATEEEDEVLGGHNVLFPEVIANAGATYRFLDGLTAAGEMNAIGTRKASPSNSLEADEPYDLNPYLLWSLSLRYDARGTWMAARALNLLDASFVEPGFNGVDLPGRGRRIVAEIGGDL